MSPAPSDTLVDDEVARFDAQAPIERARCPPTSWYFDPAFLDRERQTVFRNSWQVAGLRRDVADPGAFFTGTIGDESFVVVNDGGTLRAFHNVCRHHASCIAQGKGHADVFTCPYHGWRYALNGALRSAPRMAGLQGFDRAALSLPSIAVASLGPYVMLHLGDEDAPAKAPLQEIEQALAPTGWEALTYVCSQSYTLDCNWKVYVDNYLDGGYHIEHAHKGLAAQLDLQGYQTTLFDGGSLQVAQPADAAPVDDGLDFRARIGAGAIYAWLYPNFMINRYGDIMDTNLVIPLGPERCEVRYDYFFLNTEGDEARAFIAESIKASDRVQLEDVELCRRVQVGMRSSSYDRGWYAPHIETSMHQFHRMLAADLRAR